MASSAEEHINQEKCISQFVHNVQYLKENQLPIQTCLNSMLIASTFYSGVIKASQTGQKLLNNCLVPIKPGRNLLLQSSATNIS